MLRAFLLVSLTLLTGCAAQPNNPSFPVSVEKADRDLDRMAADQRPLLRTLVVIGGLMDPGISSVTMADRFRSVTHDDRIVVLSVFECCTFEQMRRKIIGAVERAAPCSDPTQTTAVDVVGYSIGGLAARYAALPPPDGKGRRLRIARLFTISTPNRGAFAAEKLPLLHPLQYSLRHGSEIMNEVNAKPASYPIYSYIRLGDYAVGVENAAPPGQSPWWLPTPPFEGAHEGAFYDARILADIARRLRSEKPIAATPPQALPAS
ncbi:MAG: hypothetical protein JWL69_4028 [Phycisphaerales bacterium]|nr:hypothetical protein [Phycisphaerales bacterium]MDB5354133.1 hypothetical protein [Phycisphaerales bacterium]